MKDRPHVERRHLPMVAIDADVQAADSFSLAAELAARGAIVRGRVVLPVLEPEGPRPQKRADCVDGPRPCPWVRCRFHLWRVDPDDRRGRRHPDRRLPSPLVSPTSAHTCALDVAEANVDGLHSEQIGDMLAVTGRRVLQIEKTARKSLNNALNAPPAANSASTRKRL